MMSTDKDWNAAGSSTHDSLDALNEYERRTNAEHLKDDWADEIEPATFRVRFPSGEVI